MSLLREIQSALMSEQPLGPILLKLRFLASRLGSDVLEEWIKHESEGYPPSVELPPYRRIGVAYTGFFSGPFGSAIKNAPIPSLLVEKFAGAEWNTIPIKEGVAAIADLISSARESGTLTVSADNLILLMDGKMYDGYACNSIKGTITAAALIGIENIVRTRVLELTMQIEKKIPVASEITVSAGNDTPRKDTETVSQITHQVIHGNYTSISNSGATAQFHLVISANDTNAVARELKDAGISASDAKAIAEILASEGPESASEPFGKKAREWVAKNIVKATNGTWKVGIAVATQLLTEAAKKYYGLP